MRAPGAVLAAVALAVAALPLGSAGGDPFEHGPAVDGLQPHPSILIEGDDGFDPLLNPLNGVRGGSGTAEDPYIIGGWLIPHTVDDGIRLVDTTAHVVIRDILIDRTVRPGTAVELVGASNVTIERLHVPSDNNVIVVRDADDIMVRDAVLGGDDQHPERRFGYPSITVGLNVKDVGTMVAENVTIDAADLPVSFQATEEVVLRDLHVSRAFSPSVFADNGHVLIAHSLFEGQTNTFRDHHRNISLIENVFDGGGSAISSSAWDADLEEVYVCGNTFQGMGSGLLAAQLGTALVTGNRFLHNQAGPEVRADERIGFHGNELRNATVLDALLMAPTVEAHGNSIVSDEAFIMNTPDGDARHNWWGSADGPSEDGPGNGTPLRIAGNTTFGPWLTEPPEITTDCIPGAPPAP